MNRHAIGSIDDTTSLSGVNRFQMQQLSRMQAITGGPSTGAAPAAIADHVVIDQVDLSAESLGILDKNQAPLSYYRALEDYNREKNDYDRRMAMHSVGRQDAWTDSPAYKVHDDVATGGWIA